MQVQNVEILKAISDIPFELATFPKGRSSQTELLPGKTQQAIYHNKL